MKSLLLALPLALAACASSTSVPDAQDAARETPLAGPTPHVYRTVAADTLSAYVFGPAAAGTPAGAVLLFHGGGWSVGTPRWTFDAARRFADHGLVAIAVQYRLSGAGVTPIEALADVCAAFVWTRDHAAELGLDPARVAGYGVSAGGHLVASTATVGCEAGGADAAPDALLLWSPALDMARDGWFAQKLQGRATAEAYSPLAHVRASTPPTSIVQGAADTLTPLSGAERFCDGLSEEGVRCDLHVYPGVGHLLTRNLAQQERDFDPDPAFVAAGIAEHLAFLQAEGFIRAD